LSNFRFVYIAASTVHFERAEACFTALVKAPFRHATPEELERYFQLREAWERKQYRMLSTEDIEWLDRASQRFGGARVEWLYRLWGSHNTGKPEWRELLTDGQAPHNAEFRTVLITSTTVAALTRTRRAG